MQIKPGQESAYAEYQKINGEDAYSARVVSYGEEWADKMETGISEGKGLTDIAGPLSDEANTDGITGFMYGAAVSALAKFWVHGEELRRWHNLKTQIGNEGKKANKTGGTLNPALLSIQK